MRRALPLLALAVTLAAPAAAQSSDPIDAFVARSDWAVRRTLPLPLSPNGHELADALLKPLAKPQAPVAAAERAALVAEADALLANRVTLLAGYPAQDLGTRIDWFRTPGGDLQWPTHLSRHAWLKPLARAYQVTGDERYARHLVAVLLDWQARFPLGAKGLDWTWKTPPGGGGEISGEGLMPGYFDGPWTSLSAHVRVENWLEMLPEIAASPALDNRAVAILLESLMGPHRRLLLDFPRDHTANQFLGVGAGLVQLSIDLSTLSGGAEAQAAGLARVTRYAREQIYPDGSVAEVSPNYGIAALGRLSETLRRMRAQPWISVAPVICERLAKAVRYYALIADPAGRSPRIAKGGAPVFDTLRTLNADARDPEAAWVLSGGREGTQPALDHGFDWAGHYVMRSSWRPDATWLFFEPGSRGTGHADLATLNVQLIANGQALLADPGFFSYSNVGDDGAMAAYLKSTAAHNAATVDGVGQVHRAAGAPRGPNTAATDHHWQDGTTTASADGRYVFDLPGGPVTHDRGVVFHKSGRRVGIVDRFTGGAAHRYDIYWQAPPEARVRVRGRTVRIETPRAIATLRFTGDRPLAITTARGARNPLSGWYSAGYGELTPTTTIRLSMTGAGATLRTDIAVAVKAGLPPLELAPARE